jgi:succinate-semialdehyde dehydrogenase
MHSSPPIPIRRAEVEATLSANAVAYLLWRDTPMAERVAAYRRLAATLRDRSETLASLITAEMGKTIGAARAEIEKSAATIEWIAEHGPEILADEPVSVATTKYTSLICRSAPFSA